MRNSSTLSLTSALYGGGWSMPRPDRFTPLKETLNPLYKTMGGPQGRSGRGRKIKPPPRFHPPTVQPIASRYTDWAIPAQTWKIMLSHYLSLWSQQLMQTVWESSVPTSQKKKHSLATIKTNRLILFNEIIIFYFESYLKHINTSCRKITE